MRINDISVSRCHAIIKFKEGRFQLEDNLSKFGTLVLVKNRTLLVPGFNKAVQIGRTVINFSVKSTQGIRNFGPRPQEALIKEKFEDLKEFQLPQAKQPTSAKDGAAAHKKNRSMEVEEDNLQATSNNFNNSNQQLPE